MLPVAKGLLPFPDVLVLVLSLKSLVMWQRKTQPWMMKVTPLQTAGAWDTTLGNLLSEGFRRSDSALRRGLQESQEGSF